MFLTTNLQSDQNMFPVADGYNENVQSRALLAIKVTKGLKWGRAHVNLKSFPGSRHICIQVLASVRQRLLLNKSEAAFGDSVR